jgi:dTDP-4-dehydrorhamnose 3,5-epimerase
MRIESLAIPDVKLIWPSRHWDERGFFSETWNRAALADQGIDIEFVQENHSLSANVGAVRGLHFQAPPRAQHKLVRVVRGRIFDVAVDIRKASPTYGHWVGAEISAADWNQMLIPVGFAHGFCAMEPDTEVVYLVSDIYSQNDEGAIRWDDKDLGINWPVAEQAAQVSAKDHDAPSFSAYTSPF